MSLDYRTGNVEMMAYVSINQQHIQIRIDKIKSSKVFKIKLKDKIGKKKKIISLGLNILNDEVNLKL